MRRLVFTLTLVIAVTLGSGTARAVGYPWEDHAAPFDFLFENHIDTHQQSKTVGQDQLAGFFYIKFTGGLTDGAPDAEHADCTSVPDECTTGWMLKGVAIRATLLSHESGQHPIWCVNSADIPNSPGYTHFHWLDASEHAGGLTVGQEYDGYLLKLTAVDTFFFRHHGGFLVTPGIDYETHANIVTDCE